MAATIIRMKGDATSCALVVTDTGRPFRAVVQVYSLYAMGRTVLEREAVYLEEGRAVAVWEGILLPSEREGRESDEA